MRATSLRPSSLSSPATCTLPRRRKRSSAEEEHRPPKDSVANVSQIITIDKRFLTKRVGNLPAPLYEKVEAGLELILL